jgi:hypothetical protein
LCGATLLVRARALQGANMLCEVGTRLNDALATATLAVGEHVEMNRNCVKDSAYGAKEDALERAARREASFAFIEDRDRCPICAAR